MDDVCGACLFSLSSRGVGGRHTTPSDIAFHYEKEWVRSCTAQSSTATQTVAHYMLWSHIAETSASEFDQDSAAVMSVAPLATAD